MSIAADQTRCIGSGSCVNVAPHTFDQDDEGTVVVMQPEPDGADLEAALAAIELCPVRALTA
jgi:ferredoxin